MGIAVNHRWDCGIELTAGFFPANTEVRRIANAALSNMQLNNGHARIKECRGAPCAAYDVFHRQSGAKRGRKVFTVVLRATQS